ncbi:hypothetical protein Ga0466249_004953 [Sporomusaceae bacterium BoRhaA]|uniref:hypothetical protein n=1 Tax=Pelorhabdus rhamnosifermentans TaxID=2772457 RepID=UPI001C062D93|nr:hypothetical protein [Pelorhabdus rhamnosifermentans]MBU2703803.1 hypothetical protein [Pelorhabdus rhamnosifermentans]
MAYIKSFFTFLKSHWQIVVKIILLIILFYFIYRGFLAIKQDYESFKDEIRNKTVQTNTIVQQPTIIQGQTKTDTQTKIQYVEKPVLVYTDPVTGQTKEQIDPTDVKLTADPAKVNVSVNGKPYAFDLLQGESQKFEKGQVTLDQNSTISFKMDVQPTIIDNTASGGIDVYAGNKDIGIGVRHNRVGIDAGWNHKDKDMEYRLRWEAIQFK